MTPDQKLKIYREAQTDPGSALLTALEVLKGDMFNKISEEVKKIYSVYEEMILKTEEEKITPEQMSRALLEKSSFKEILKGEKGLPGELGLKGDKGDQGIPGVTGPKGDKGDSIVGPQGPRGLQGKGIAGPRGIEGKQGKKGEDGQNGSSDTGNDIVAKINLSNLKIDASHIKDLPKLKGKAYKHGGGDTVLAGSGVTITINTDGSKTISAAGTLTILTATGTRNNANAVFSFTQKPTFVVANGQWLRENAGWTWSNPNATLGGPVGTEGDIYGVV